MRIKSSSEEIGDKFAELVENISICDHVFWDGELLWICDNEWHGGVQMNATEVHRDIEGEEESN